MIYPEAKFSPGGDRYILIEFGNEMNLELNFLGQGLGSAIRESKLQGVVETAPSFASTLIHYEPNIINYGDLVEKLKILIKGLGSIADIELPSRLHYIPCCYLDPWTSECIEDYREKITDKVPDAEMVAQLNGLSGTDELVRVHSGTEYWVASLGFWPGLPFMMPLDPRCKLTAPKYNPPRTWTPEGAVGMGGASTAIYPVATPGGYQIFGRTPVPIWDTKKRFSPFKNDICLFKPGDRVKFVPISKEEFVEIEQRVADGTYVYNIAEYQKFSVSQYKTWLSSLDLNQRF